MLTREQIKALIRDCNMAQAFNETQLRPGAEPCDVQVDEGPLRDLCGMALRALDTAKDAALGRAVRERLGVLDAARCDRIADDAFKGVVYGTDARGFGELMRVFAAHLRAEKAKAPHA